MRVHVVFKTHLDLGFTALANDVVERYMQSFIPNAMSLARASRQEGKERFIWTTGSWLIYEYLERAKGEERKAMEEAIAAGDIVWHALPFTTHTELMDASLFRHGLSLSQSLDARFGKKTIAAKMTDVPGHTKAMLPLLAEAGVRFLHFGVNGASTVPDVPPVFNWYESGAEIVVMYSADYGGLQDMPELPAILAFGHTNDNHGPQDDGEVIKVYENLRTRYPDCEIVGSTLDAYATELLTAQKSLPTVTAEIGDTWIHGVGTDPLKVVQFKKLSAWRKSLETAHPSFTTSRPLRIFSTELLKIAEHTWGRDVKRWRDAGTRWESYVEETYETAAFLKKRQLGTYDELETSWSEQREYLNQAVAMLAGTSLGESARKILVHAGRSLGATEGFTLAAADEPLQLGRFQVRVDGRTGGLTSLKLDASTHDWADETHPCGSLTYQTFGDEDYERFYNQYNQQIEKVDFWARPDFTKPGLGNTLVTGTTYEASLLTVEQRSTPDAGELRLRLTWDQEPIEKFGAPADVTMILRFAHASPSLEWIIDWKQKQACRVAEALWLDFLPKGIVNDGSYLVKMDRPISPSDVASGGARTLHACEQIHCEGAAGQALVFDLETIALVAPGRKSLLDFHNEVPDMAADGFHLNLFNNVWGTNFPMWHEDDVCQSFRINFV
ncbi:MAG TPA: DUF5054 domain-containing protein [Chthoniobacterales bacterium]